MILDGEMTQHFRAFRAARESAMKVGLSRDEDSARHTDKQEKKSKRMKTQGHKELSLQAGYANRMLRALFVHSLEAPSCMRFVEL